MLIITFCFTCLFLLLLLLSLLLVSPSAAVWLPINVSAHGEDHVRASAPGTQQGVGHIASDLIEEGHWLLLL